MKMEFQWFLMVKALLSDYQSKNFNLNLKNANYINKIKIIS